MNCCICGPVKNCAPYLSKVFSNIEKIGALFQNYTIVVYYDTSTDNTLKILKQYQKKNPKLLIYINKKPISKLRTHNLAIARNFCLQFIKENQDQFPFFIMMDFDDVNCKHLSIEPLKESLKREDWDALSFNTSPKYYDLWALSIQPYYFSYTHFHTNSNYNYYTIQNYIDLLLKKVTPGKLLPCISSFNGFSIYRTKMFVNTYYDGRIRLDLFPRKYIEEHARAANSNLVYQILPNVDCRYEDCEHRAFHLQAIQNSGARIRISPKVLFY
jgi:hypothetical protein